MPASASSEPCTTSGGWIACFEAPVDPSRDGGIDDIPAWHRLVLTSPEGRAVAVDLREDRIFADFVPRLADVGGDGNFEIVVVESDPAGRSQLSVYEPHRGGLLKTAATPETASAGDSLAPVAVADLDGNGVLDIAYVDHPHGAGVLRVWTFAPGGLTETASVPGYSNHRIGEAAVLSGLRDCGGARELVLPDVERTRLDALRLESGSLVARPIASEASEAALALALRC